MLQAQELGIGDRTELDKEELESPQRPVWVIKSNPSRIVWGPIPFTAEYRLNVETINSRYRSSEIGVSYLGESVILNSIVNSSNSNISGNFGRIDLQVSGARLQFAHKFYLKGALPFLDPDHTMSSFAPNGYYIAPYFSLSYARFKVNHSTRPFLEMTHMNGNLIIGRQMFFDHWLSLDVFLGIGYKENLWEFQNTQNYNIANMNNDDMGPYGGNSRFVLGINVGVAF